MALRNGEAVVASHHSQPSARQLISYSRFSKTQIVGRHSFIRSSAYFLITVTWLTMAAPEEAMLYRNKVGFFPATTILLKHFGPNRLRTSALGSPCLQTDCETWRRPKTGLGGRLPLPRSTKRPALQLRAKCSALFQLLFSEAILRKPGNCLVFSPSQYCRRSTNQLLSRKLPSKKRLLNRFLRVHPR